MFPLLFVTTTIALYSLNIVLSFLIRKAPNFGLFMPGTGQLGQVPVSILHFHGLSGPR